MNENSPVGKAIANISVVDPDNEGDFNGRQSASCQVSLDTSNVFDVNRGVVLVIKQSNLDFEKQSRYIFSIDLSYISTGLHLKSKWRNRSGLNHVSLSESSIIVWETLTLI